MRGECWRVSAEDVGWYEMGPVLVDLESLFCEEFLGCVG